MFLFFLFSCSWPPNWLVDLWFCICYDFENSWFLFLQISLFCSLFSLQYSNYIHIILFENFPHYSNVIFWVFFFSYFFLLAFQFGTFLLNFFMFTEFSCVTFTDEPIKGILHLCYCIFLLLEVPFDSFHLSAYITHMYFHCIYLFH